MDTTVASLHDPPAGSHANNQQAIAGRHLCMVPQLLFPKMDCMSFSDAEKDENAMPIKSVRRNRLAGFRLMLNLLCLPIFGGTPVGIRSTGHGGFML
ncbi:hypothetical protein [Methylomicrobium agile]|uniref:hypothetical protein n=1 Tax=Methylomicrobium agile TaxID=39774 RepID=UPI0012F6AF77|nr:hypothetical protein [Methylomicrobium agile]